MESHYLDIVLNEKQYNWIDSPYKIWQISQVEIRFTCEEMAKFMNFAKNMYDQQVTACMPYISLWKSQSLNFCESVLYQLYEISNIC